MNENHTPLDKLIRESLHDNVPNDAEEKMNMQINAFFEEHQESGYASIPDFHWIQPFLEWFAKPEVSFAVTAALFACMISLTASMHISKEKNALATTIDTIQLMAKVFSAIESSQSLIIKEQIIERDENSFVNRIQWVKDISRIDFQDQEVWVMQNGTTEIYHPGKQSTAITPLHETAALFATPEKLTYQLMGRWKVTPSKPPNPSNPLEIIIENLREEYTVRMWLDQTTNLPHRIQTTAAERPGGGIIEWQNIQMNFVWNQPVDSELLQTVNFEGEEE